MAAMPPGRDFAKSRIACRCQAWRPVSITTKPAKVSKTTVLPSGWRFGRKLPGIIQTPGAMACGFGASPGCANTTAGAASQISAAIAERMDVLPCLAMTLGAWGRAFQAMRRRAAREFGLRGPLDRRAAYAGVGEAARAHVVGLIDIAQIDQHRRVHQELDAVEVERPELIPFGDDRSEERRVGKE